MNASFAYGTIARRAPRRIGPCFPRLHKAWTAARFSWQRLGDPLKRGADIALAAAALAVTAPLVLPLWGVLRWQLDRIPCAGQDAAPFDHLFFKANPGTAFAGLIRYLHLTHWPALWNLLRGDVTLVGPRPAAFATVEAPRGRSTPHRFLVKPGFVCTWWLRERVSIGYGTEAAADWEYVESQSLLSDLGIALRSAWAALIPKARPAPGATVQVLDARIDNLTMDEAVDRICALASRGPASNQICFVNPHCLNVACRNGQYRRVLRESRLVLADGIGLQLAARWLGGGLRQNVNGTDLFPLLCRKAAASGLRVYLLGAQSGTVEHVRDWMQREAPGVIVSGMRDGFFAASEEPEVIRGVERSCSDILLVAMGVPRQDIWIREHLPELGVRVAIGVGGLFDFYSGRIPRAPIWMREAGLEWVFRLIQEPGRLWKRYLVGNVVFLVRVLRERLARHHRRGAA